MIIQNTDLFNGLSQEALNEISKAVIVESHSEGTVIYTDKDPATNFYSLVDGRVQLAIGKEAQIDYTVNRAGEVFGWSSMVDRKFYTTTAKCVIPTKVAKIGKEKLYQILEKHPRDGAIFYKRLASAVVQRLIDNYSAFLSEGNLQGVTYGSGQIVVGSEE
ncbi:MAG: cyclic nucleotide-binding domain-containing protein [Pseudomonadota bacterium]